MLDFKLVACAGKPLVKLEDLPTLSLSVSTQPQIEDAPMADERGAKKRPPEGRSWLVREEDAALEVETAARIEDVEIVDRFSNAFQFAMRRDR